MSICKTRKCVYYNEKKLHTKINSECTLLISMNNECFVRIFYIHYYSFENVDHKRILQFIL